MAEYICVLFVTALLLGFVLGRWHERVYSGDIIVSKDAETCTFSLDIPADEISQYSELVFRVVTEESSHHG